MKNFKKIAGIMLALVMVLAMAVPAFAATDADTPTGKITINKAVEGQSYAIYKMFDLEYNTTTEAFLYRANDERWRAFAKGDIGKQYFNVDADNYVTLKEGVDAAAAALIAEEALKYAKANSISPVVTLPNANPATPEEKYVADGLELGYYLVDSSLGALCGLTTTKTEATVDEKNGTPTVDKKVKVGSKDYDDNNTANIGDTVDFKTVITVAAGAEKYVLHDIMDDTFEFNNDISVQVLNPTDTDITADANVQYTTSVGNETGTETDPVTPCTFEVKFFDDTNDYVKGLAVGTQIVVTYSAKLKDNAKMSPASNDNETWLKFGENKTAVDTTKTVTYSFDLVKTDKDDKVIDGAEFELYTAETNGTKINLVLVETNAEGVNIYRKATPEEEGAADFTSAVIKAGKATVKGLEKGTYWLEETKAPTGYNKLTAALNMDFIYS